MGTVDNTKAGGIPAQVIYGTAANTAAQGNDSRITGAAQAGTGGVQVLTPTTGDTVEITPTSYNTTVFINASATIAALTLHFHDGTQEGQQIALLCEHVVTTATFTGNYDTTWNPANQFSAPGSIGAGMVGFLVWHSGAWYAYRLAF